MRHAPVVLVEFNELCPHLIDRWIDSGDLPNFQRLRDSSTVLVTEADEKNYPYLEPWIQWYSLHTGLPYSEHGVFRLTEGASRPYLSVWDRLLEQGHRVMSFSSMNCRGFEGGGSVFLPDPWNDGERAVPSELEIFRQFVVKAVQSQSGAKWRVGELAAVGRFLVTNGLSSSTVAALVMQLVSEATSSGATHWRRVQILDRLLLDVFLHLYRKHAPVFATFFSNSTAHLQHAYWRYLEPERFSEPSDPQNQRRYANAVNEGYRSMDRMLGTLMAVTEAAGARIMFATALSQQAYIAYEGRGGRHYYRPRDVEALLARAGVPPAEVQPVMAHQFILRFASEAERARGETALTSVTMNGRQLFDTADGDEPTRMIFGAQIYAPQSDDARFEIGGKSEPFFAHFRKLEATKSGGHHPDGCFWIQTGSHVRPERKVSILDVAPTILAHFGITPKDMRGAPISTAG